MIGGRSTGSKMGSTITISGLSRVPPNNGIMTATVTIAAMPPHHKGDIAHRSFF